MPRTDRGAGHGAPIVRQATAADSEGIARVHVAAWRWAYVGIMPAALLEGLSVEERAAGWRRGFTADRPGRVVRVAEAAGEVVGFCGGGPARDADLGDHAGEVFTLYVLRDWLGQGLGAALFAAVTSALGADGREPIVLWVAQRNRLGRSFYERCGWRRDGHRKAELMGDRRLYELRYRAPWPRAGVPKRR